MFNSRLLLNWFQSCRDLKESTKQNVLHAVASYSTIYTLFVLGLVFFKFLFVLYLKWLVVFSQ